MLMLAIKTKKKERMMISKNCRCPFSEIMCPMAIGIQWVGENAFGAGSW